MTTRWTADEAYKLIRRIIGSTDVVLDVEAKANILKYGELVDKLAISLLVASADVYSDDADRRECARTAFRKLAELKRYLNMEVRDDLAYEAEEAD